MAAPPEGAVSLWIRVQPRRVLLGREEISTHAPRMPRECPATADVPDPLTRRASSAPPRHAPSDSVPVLPMARSQRGLFQFTDWSPWAGKFKGPSNLARSTPGPSRLALATHPAGRGVHGALLGRPDRLG